MVLCRLFRCGCTRPCNEWWLSSAKKPTASRVAGFPPRPPPRRCRRHANACPTRAGADHVAASNRRRCSDHLAGERTKGCMGKGRMTDLPGGSPPGAASGRPRARLSRCGQSQRVLPARHAALLPVRPATSATKCTHADCQDTVRPLDAVICTGLVLGRLPARAEETIRCESLGFRYDGCRVDTEKRVGLVRKHGFMDCREVSSWAMTGASGWTGAARPRFTWVQASRMTTGWRQVWRRRLAHGAPRKRLARRTGASRVVGRRAEMSQPSGAASPMLHLTERHVRSRAQRPPRHHQEPGMHKLTCCGRRLAMQGHNGDDFADSAAAGARVALRLSA